MGGAAGAAELRAGGAHSGRRALTGVGEHRWRPCSAPAPTPSHLGSSCPRPSPGDGAPTTQPTGNQGPAAPPRPRPGCRQSRMWGTGCAGDSGGGRTLGHILLRAEKLGVGPSRRGWGGGWPTRSRSALMPEPPAADEGQTAAFLCLRGQGWGWEGPSSLCSSSPHNSRARSRAGSTPRNCQWPADPS